MISLSEVLTDVNQFHCEQMTNFQFATSEQIDSLFCAGRLF